MTVATPNRNVLWVSYSFLPIINGENIQSAGYAKYMARRGWRCFVITSNPTNALNVNSTIQEVLKAKENVSPKHIRGLR